MASLKKRKQLVNELRSAHFPFGFEDNKGIESEYIEKYKEYQLNWKQKTNNNARMNNFDLNDGNSINNYISQFKQRYPGHIPHLQSNNIPTKNQDGKFIVMGYDGPDYLTNYNNDYPKKVGEPFDRGQAVDQKKPNIQLGDTLTDFATTYKKNYQPKVAQRCQNIDPSARKSNFILGHQKPNYGTQHNLTYLPKPIQNYHATGKPNASNIALGGDGGQYKSQNMANFAHKEHRPYVVSKEQVRDFRNAHFHLGFPEDKIPIQSEARAQYNEKPINVEKGEGNRASNINLNFDNNNYFNSTYGKEFVDKPYSRAQPLNKNGQANNVLMGADDNPDHYLSQAKAQFGKKDPQYQRVKPQKQEDSLGIGNGKGDYLTHNQDTYKNRFKDRHDNRLTMEEINRLKGLNFQTGFHGINYDLESQNYGKRQGKCNKLDKDVLDKMRNTNIIEGDYDPFKGNTIYRTSFPWKKGQE